MDLESRIRDIKTQLDSVGYKHSIASTLNTVLAAGKSDPAFTSIVSWISKEISTLCDLESIVQEISDIDDDESFSLEVSSLLRELFCPQPTLTEGPFEDRLEPCQNKILLLEFLISELQAAKLSSTKNPLPKPVTTVEIPESPVAKTLKKMLVSLNFGKPPPTISAIQLFTKVEEKLLKLQNSAKKPFKPLFTGFLSEKQWYQLGILQQDMHAEYTTRRKMLITRWNLTIDSFCWGERLKPRENEIINTYMTYKNQLSVEPSVDIAHLLSADDIDTVTMNVTSDASCRTNTKSCVNTVIIGMVPDRGGRPDEQMPPPPEIPSWQKPTNTVGGSSQRGSFQSSSYKNNQGSSNTGNFENTHKNYQGDTKSREDNRADTGGRYKPTAFYSGGGSYDHQSRSPGYGFVGSIASCGDTGYNIIGLPPNVGNYVPQNPHTQFMPRMYQITDPTPLDFGIGIGGYSATGGNFQQHGSTQYSINDSNQYNRGSGLSRGRRSRGRRP